MVSPEMEKHHTVGRTLSQAGPINSAPGVEPAMVGSNDE